jgi:hypothetical protein
MKKLKDKIEAARQKRGSPQPPPEKTGAPSAKMRWLVALTFIALVGAGVYTILHFYILTRVPLAMVGTWVVMEVKTKGGGKIDESLKGGRLEFRRDGTMIGKVNMDGKEGTIKGTVEVEGQTLRITSVNPITGQPVTDVQAIRTLESDQFVIEDRNGTMLIMERMRD